MLDGKEAASNEKLKLSYLLKSFTSAPHLAVIVVGDNPASAAYVRGKQRDCEECGISMHVFKFDANVTEQELLKQINSLNINKYIHGIIVQLPLPAHISAAKVTAAIDPLKDVDCFCYDNVGRLVADCKRFTPCTPQGAVDLLRYYRVPVEGKHCVVIGRSNIVGKPMAIMLTSLGATVTLCHSKTVDLARHTKEADIIICAVGKPKFITADMISEGAVVIDVGINRGNDGKLRGDVDFENVSKKVSAITPVPGGVGLMTRVALLKNVVAAYIGDKVD